MKLALALFAFTFATPVLAQTDTQAAKGRIKFIDMSDMLLEAGPVPVPGVFIDRVPRPNFESLVRLQHDVIPKMKRTARDVALR